MYYALWGLIKILKIDQKRSLKENRLFGKGSLISKSVFADHGRMQEQLASLPFPWGEGAQISRCAVCGDLYIIMPFFWSFFNLQSEKGQKR